MKIISGGVLYSIEVVALWVEAQGFVFFGWWRLLEPLKGGGLDVGPSRGTRGAKLVRNGCGTFLLCATAEGRRVDESFMLFIEG